jgi:uncharacterized protein (DUF2141 family)
MDRKLLFFIMCAFFTIGYLAANEVSFSIEVQGVTVNGGTIYGAIYSNNNSYRNTQPEYTFRGEPINGILTFNLQIPAGEYAIQVYQDTNNNGRLDFGLFNIPKEPVGISNWNGRGIPGNYDRHKVTINNGAKIPIQIN